jgi:RNA polymerase sigma-70 factor (ECF subfamily)
MTPHPSNVTKLLRKARDGDRAALDELLPLIYAELKHIARVELGRDRAEHTLQPTALVHEAYLRLFGSSPPPSVNDRVHFFSIVAKVMRQVLVDYARVRRAQKRGSGLQIPLEDSAAVLTPPMSDLLLVNEALDRLEREDPRLVTLIEMRFFAGMTAEDAAEALNDSVHVVRHDLRYAQARLRHFLDSPAPLV